MACPTVTTGQGFLAETLSHLDCQAQVLGSFGFQSLAEAGSPASMILTALLTLFIALFGIRMLFGGHAGPHDVVGAVLKVGIVLTLAMSWPAYRTLAYDTVLHGPAEITALITGGSLMASSGGLTARMQGVDDGIAALTEVGAGRQTGSLDVPGEQTDSFRSVALEDETGFGLGRTFYLATAIGMLATLRLGAGILLAVAPLFAGLLLFEITRGLFVGWLRGLALTVIGSIGMTVLFSVQVAILEPWVVDTLNRRNLGYATPNAPTELLALSVGFAIASLGLLALLTKVAFQNGWPFSLKLQPPPDLAGRNGSGAAFEPVIDARPASAQSRALVVGEGVRAAMRYETSHSESRNERRTSEVLSRHDGGRTSDGGGSARREPLGNTHRRNQRSNMGSQQRRDLKA